MQNRASAWIGAALAIGIAFPAAAQDTTADTVVATVNGTDITVGHMIVLRAQLPQQYRQLPDEVLFEGIMEQLIRQTVLSQQVTDEPKAVTLQLDNEHRALLASIAIDKSVNAAVTEEAIQAAYEAAIADMEPVQEYNASHILVETEVEAQDLLIALQEGADFAELAKEKSTGPSGPNGGNLGWFEKGQMVKPFEDAIVELSVGETSAPVQTQFGWHVARLNETRERPVPAIDEMRDELLDTVRQEILETVIAELTDQADVQRSDVTGIDPSVLSDVSLLGN